MICPKCFNTVRTIGEDCFYCTFCDATMDSSGGYGPFTEYMSDEEASKATGYSLDRPITRYYEWKGEKHPVYGGSDFKEVADKHEPHWVPSNKRWQKPYETLAYKWREHCWRGQFIESLAKCEACRKEMEKE